MDARIIEPRQRFRVTIVDSEGNLHPFEDGGFSVSASGVLSVTTYDGKHACAWAPGFWARCFVTAVDA